jgi:ectoine hydroxylase-related dioxygenase (phytanoyl-CoA dioxygenase family)
MTKIFSKRAPNGNIEIVSDTHGDTVVIFPGAVEHVQALTLQDMTEDTPLLVVTMSHQSLEIPFSSRTNVKRAFEQLQQLLESKTL